MPDFDASSIIYAWDNYPIENFPPLWRWVGGQIANNTFGMSEVAFQEVEYKAPECAGWLRKQNVTQTRMMSEIAQEALRIKAVLRIKENNYHPNCVD